MQSYSSVLHIQGSIVQQFRCRCGTLWLSGSVHSHFKELTRMRLLLRIRPPVLGITSAQKAHRPLRLTNADIGSVVVLILLAVCRSISLVLTEKPGMCFASLRAINIYLGITALPVVFFCLRRRFLKLALAPQHKSAGLAHIRTRCVLP